MRDRVRSLQLRALVAGRRIARRLGVGPGLSGSEGARTEGFADDTVLETGAARVQDPHQALKRATVFLLTLAAVALSARAIVGERGMLDAHRAAHDLAVLKQETAKWQERNAYLEKRIKALRGDPATIEAVARERLDWVRPGEITFLFPHDPAALEPGDPGPVAPGEFQPATADDLDSASSEKLP